MLRRYTKNQEEGIEMERFVPMKLFGGRFIFYVASPRHEYYCKTCINGNSVLRSNRLVMSARMFIDGLPNSLCIAKLEDGDFVHVVYNLNGMTQPEHLWGRYDGVNDTILVMSVERYKELRRDVRTNKTT